MVGRKHIILTCLLAPKSTLDCAWFDESGPGDKGQLECDSGEVISVEHAWYGRTSTTECSAGDGTYDSWYYRICDSGLNVTTNVAAVCDGKTTCEFRGMGTFDTDPCVSIHKYTKILYNCIRK